MRHARAGDARCLRRRWSPRMPDCGRFTQRGRQRRLIGGNDQPLRVPAVTRSVFEVTSDPLDFQNHRHDQRPPRRLLRRCSASGRRGSSPSSRPNRSSPPGSILRASWPPPAAPFCINSDPSSPAANPRLTISGRLSMRPVCRLMAMIGSTMPSSERCRRSRITISCTTSSTEPESMQTRPTVTLPALRAPCWSIPACRPIP